MLIPLVSVCHRCPFSELNQPGFKGGACACTADQRRRDITELAAAGECPQGRFDGMPKTTVGAVVHGAVGIVKALGRINRASDEVIEQRRRTCSTCEKAVLTAGGVFRRCSICGCALALKILTADEKCPVGKW